MKQLPRVIGMVHLLPLPGSPRFRGSLSEVVDAACRDASTLSEAGVDAVMVENFGDAPFFPDQVPTHTVASVTAICSELRRHIRCELGVNILRNDGLAAISIAEAVGASFIRINILTGARLTDQGIISGRAAEILRLRAQLNCSARIFADIDVKHSAPIAPYPLESEIADTIERGMADALIVSGRGTGHAPSPTEVAAIRQKSTRPVYIGSGINLANLASYAGLIDGFIVGTSIKNSDDIFSPVSKAKTTDIVQKFRQI
jgi:membrane complex biogenesis BtpA family protein